MKVFVILLLAAALTGVSVAAAQGEEPVTVDPLQPGEPVEIAAPVQEAPVAADVSPESFVPPPWWNMLQNGSFETGGANPVNWAKDAWASGANFKWDSSTAYLGGKSAKITVNVANDARWIQTVTVEPNTDYVLSGWIKTQNVAHTAETVDAGANLSILGGYTRTPALFGTSDWTFVKVIFNTGSASNVTVAARVGMYNGTTTGTAWFDKIQLAPVKMLYVSSSQSGTVAGINFAPADILIHDPVRNTWGMYFDGSDVGITKNIDAFDVIWTGTIVMSLSAAQNVPGMGMIKPQDLIFFEPTSTGSNTAGSFSWNWLGSGAQVGLDTPTENVDAVEYISAYLISTNGAMNAPGVSNGRDEDLFIWDCCSSWDWNTRLDGSNVPGLAVEDVWGVSVDNVCCGRWLLTTQDTYYPGDGRRFTNKQIFALEGTTVLSPVFWTGPDHGFNYILDGISLAAN